MEENEFGRIVGALGDDAQSLAREGGLSDLRRQIANREGAIKKTDQKTDRRRACARADRQACQGGRERARDDAS